MMTSESPDSKGRDRTISALDGFIQVLDLAKNACGIPPAQAAFGAASILLTMIRVRFSPFCRYDLRAHVYPGLDDQ